MRLLFNFYQSRNPHYRAALRAAKILRQHEYEAYIIGGAVRDMLLGVSPKDFDIVTNATPNQVRTIETFHHKTYSDSAHSFGVTRVEMPVMQGFRRIQSPIEITTFRKDINAHKGRKATTIEFSSLHDDVTRRDFTMNALAYDPATGQILDLIDGVDDVRNGIVRFIGSPAKRIAEDPVRILRGIRLKNQLEFSYDERTKLALKKAVHAGALNVVAPDRIRQELNRMLTHPSRVKALVDLEQLGVLRKLLPEVQAMKGVEQPESIHAEGTVWTHTLLAMRYLPSHPSQRLTWATLLHDVGKPPTAQPPKNHSDRIRFNDHSEVGAEIATTILSRLNISKRTIQDVSWMIRYHLGIDDLPKMRSGRQASVMSHPAFEDLMLLHKADAHAAWSQNPDGSINSAPASFPILERMFKSFIRTRTKPVPSLKHDLGIDGHWLIQNYQLTGKELGAILTHLNNAYLDSEIHSVDDAKALVTKLRQK